MNTHHYLNAHIPNWDRFIQKYQPSQEFVKAFEDRIDLIYDSDKFEQIAGYINVELGVLLLRHTEIRESELQGIIDSLNNNNKET